MRGKANDRSFCIVGTGITPAYAGKRSWLHSYRSESTDHPRLCGEKILILPRCKFFPGSPPPMRGKASVGLVTRGVAEDHPRLCGEKGITNSLLNNIPGSPPPMRGKGLTECLAGGACGITPAYAGKRSLQSYGQPFSWDHPRLCGEKTKKIPKQRYFFHQPASFSFSLQYT